eukprot:3699999-Heterocapsa_arctica.AAC.1
MSFRQGASKMGPSVPGRSIISNSAREDLAVGVVKELQDDETRGQATPEVADLIVASPGLSPSAGDRGVPVEAREVEEWLRLRRRRRAWRCVGPPRGRCRTGAPTRRVCFLTLVDSSRRRDA